MVIETLSLSLDPELFYFRSVWGWGATEDVAKVKKGIERFFRYDALAVGRWELEVSLTHSLSHFLLFLSIFTHRFSNVFTRRLSALDGPKVFFVSSLV